MPFSKGIVGVALAARLACGNASEAQGIGGLCFDAAKDEHDNNVESDAEIGAGIYKEAQALSLLQAHFQMQRNASQRENGTHGIHAPESLQLEQADARRDLQKDLTDLTAPEKWSLWFYSMVALFAVGYGIYPRASDVTAKPRDERWDMCRFWCMLQVVWLHMFIYEHHYPMPLPISNPSLRSLSFERILDFTGMPGFSLISGVLTPSSIIETTSGVISLNRNSLRNSLRDLVLNNATMIPLIFILAGITSILSAASFSAITKPWLAPWGELCHAFGCGAVPIVRNVPHAWYLGSLFMWRLLVPVLVELRLPLLTLSVVAVIVRVGAADEHKDKHWPNPTLSLLPFFVLGFVLAGGGLQAEARKARLEKLRSLLVDGRVRIAAATVIVCYVILMQVGDLPEILVRIFCTPVSVNQDIPTPWHLGGPFTDLLRMACTALLNLAIFVMIFAAPSSPIVSAAGRRTLYVYLLHGYFFPVDNSIGTLNTFSIACGKLLAGFGMNVNMVAWALYGVFKMLLLGSRFIEDLTHHFVAPQWLADLLFPGEGPIKSIDSACEASK